jgi:hypothetical protein
MAKAPIEIKSLARSHTDSCIKVLVSIAQQPNAPPAARVAAATALLDRGWGKPNQDTTVTIQHRKAAEVPDDALADIALGGSEGAITPTPNPPQLN